MEKHEIVIIGGGPAGMAAALSAEEHGVRDVLILEREEELGGILNQCIHNGFGLHTFGEELTGPEYAARYEEWVKQRKLPCLTGTTVLGIRREEENGGEGLGNLHPKTVTAVNRDRGIFQIQASAVILAMGCRERPRGALNIPGYRPAGIYSAGTAQRLVNQEGVLPGKEIVILGSGDIGLIMARRMTLEGARVKVVAERLPHPGGLMRNVVQCLEDYGIPLKLNCTAAEIHGKERVEGVTLVQLDGEGRPISGTEEYYACDTLLLSVGLIPENELTRGMGAAMDEKTGGPAVSEELETSVPGVFACGNVLHVHGRVDNVSKEAEKAGRFAAAWVNAGRKENRK